MEQRELSRQWLRLAGQEWRGAENAEEEELAAAANVMHQLNADPAYPIDALNNYLSFVLAMARTRTENFLHLKSYYRIEGLEGVQPIKLFTPALVDFDFWLDSPETARIHDPRGICAAELARAEAAGQKRQHAFRAMRMAALPMPRPAHHPPCSRLASLAVRHSSPKSGVTPGVPLSKSK